MSHERSDTPRHCPYCGAACRTEIVGEQQGLFGATAPVERDLCLTCRNYVHIDELKEEYAVPSRDVSKGTIRAGGRTPKTPPPVNYVKEHKT